MWTAWAWATCMVVLERAMSVAAMPATIGRWMVFRTSLCGLVREDHAMGRARLWCRVNTHFASRTACRLWGMTRTGSHSGGCPLVSAEGLSRRATCRTIRLEGAQVGDQVCLLSRRELETQHPIVVGHRCGQGWRGAVMEVRGMLDKSSKRRSPIAARRRSICVGRVHARLRWRVEAAPIHVGELFTREVAGCAPTGTIEDAFATLDG